MATKEFFFGNPESRLDKDLLRYFHTTNQISGLIQPKTYPDEFLFVARPGAGKTAFKLWLQKSTQSRKVIVLGAENVRMEIDPRFNRGDLDLAMSAELAIGLVTEIYTHKLIPKEDLEKIKDTAENIISWVKDFSKKRFAGISILGFGFRLHPEQQKEYLEELRRTNKVQLANEALDVIVTRVPVTLVIDNPENIVTVGLMDTTPENAHRTGIFLGSLAELHSNRGVQVIALTKEHILQSVEDHYMDFRHYQDLISSLEWTEADLLQMIKLRIKNRLNLQWEDVFNISEKKFKEAVFPYLINGPRDLIEICNTAGSSGEKISQDLLKLGIETLRKKQWRYVKTSHGTHWPQIEVVASSMVKEIIKKFPENSFTKEEVQQLFKDQLQDSRADLFHLRQKEEWIDSAMWTPPTIDERLFSVGCLGYILEEEIFYPWRSRSLSKFADAETLFVSSLFI